MSILGILFEIANPVNANNKLSPPLVCNHTGQLLLTFIRSNEITCQKDMVSCWA